MDKEVARENPHFWKIIPWRQKVCVCGGGVYPQIYNFFDKNMYTPLADQIYYLFFDPFQ